MISFCFRRETDERFINLNQINRRGHANYTTKAYAKSRPKTNRAHILMPLLRLTRSRATNRFKCAETEVNHISLTLPEAGTRRGVAFEPLCVPSERSAPRIVE